VRPQPGSGEDALQSRLLRSYNQSITAALSIKGCGCSNAYPFDLLKLSLKLSSLCDEAPR
jgi:hypothetical protein